LRTSHNVFGGNLSGTTVEGNVTVEPGGSLKTEEKTETTITGNVQSNNATEIVLLAGGEIGGNVQIQGTTGESLPREQQGQAQCHNPEQCRLPA
jgi:hypothetical protein